MAKKQFIFGGLNWMTPEQIQNLREKLLEAKQMSNDSFEFEIVLQSDVTLNITYNSDNTMVLENRLSDDAVSFIIKYGIKKYEYINIDGEVAVDEDMLLILTINDEMQVKMQHMLYCSEFC